MKKREFNRKKQLLLGIAFIVTFISPFIILGASLDYEIVGAWSKNIPGWKIDDPEGVAYVAPDRIAVISGGEVFIMHEDGTVLLKIGYPTDKDSRSYVRDVVADKSGCVYLLDYDNYVWKIGPFGDFMTKWQSEGPLKDGFEDNVSADASGNIYVVDTANKCIKVYNKEGHLIKKITAQVDMAATVAVNSFGNIYLAIKDKHCIQKLGSNGEVILQWGKLGYDVDPLLEPPWSPAGGIFKRPEDIAIDSSDKVFVADRGNHRIQKFTADGKFISKMEEFGGNSFPECICFDRADNLYIGITHYKLFSDENEDKLYKYSPKGKLLWQKHSAKYPPEILRTPIALAFDSTYNLYIADTADNQIYRFTAGGDFLGRFGGKGKSNGKFKSPSGIAVDSSGGVYICDTGNNRIQKHDAKGKFILSIGKEGSGQCEFKNPKSIAIGSNGNLYVTDTGNSRIQKLTTKGDFITEWDGKGDASGRFKDLKAICIDSKENLFAIDGDYIKKFTLDGKFIKEWGGSGNEQGQFKNPSSITADAKGSIYVADTGNFRIQEFTADGEYIGSWGTKGNGEGQYANPCGVAVSFQGYIYVIDSGNHNIQYFRKVAVMDKKQKQ